VITEIGTDLQKENYAELASKNQKNSQNWQQNPKQFKSYTDKQHKTSIKSSINGITWERPPVILTKLVQIVLGEFELQKINS